MQSAATTSRYPSPLRYPGGKAKLANFLKLLILENSLTGTDYVEPYAGGASAALALLYEDYVGKIHINDLNPGVFRFWKLATSDPDYLCRRIRSTPLTVDEWRRQRQIYLDPSSDRDLLGFASFYLNRTNRSGIISGGVIGGLGQSGTWKIDARFDRDSLCSRVLKVARFSSRISVTNLDAVDLLQQSDYPRNTISYLDPPYYGKGARLYDNSYSHGDHAAVRDVVADLDTAWIVSYDAAQPILTLYHGYNSRIYGLSYSAGPTTSGSEVIFFSPGIVVPNVASPAGIHAPTVLKARRLAARRSQETMQEQ